MSRRRTRQWSELSGGPASWPAPPNALREKLFDIIWDSVIKEAQKISKIPVGPNDALDGALYDLEPCEWTQLHTRWKARLKKLGITRTNCNQSYQPCQAHAAFIRSAGCTHPLVRRHEKEYMTMPGRNIPGFYSIIDPITTSVRARTICFLDLPTELGDKILFFGEFPNKSRPRISQTQ